MLVVGVISRTDLRALSLVWCALRELITRLGDDDGAMVWSWFIDLVFITASEACRL